MAAAMKPTTRKPQVLFVDDEQRVLKSILVLPFEADRLCIDHELLAGRIGELPLATAGDGRAEGESGRRCAAGGGKTKKCPVEPGKTRT